MGVLHKLVCIFSCDVGRQRAKIDSLRLRNTAYARLKLSMEAFLLRPNTAVAAVCAVHTVRRLSRECRDAKAREYLIRVERRLMAIVLEDWPPTLH